MLGVLLGAVIGGAYIINSLLGDTLNGGDATPIPTFVTAEIPTTYEARIRYDGDAAAWDYHESITLDVRILGNALFSRRVINEVVHALNSEGWDLTNVVNRKHQFERSRVAHAGIPFLPTPVTHSLPLKLPEVYLSPEEWYPALLLNSLKLRHITERMHLAHEAAVVDRISSSEFGQVRTLLRKPSLSTRQRLRALFRTPSDNRPPNRVVLSRDDTSKAEVIADRHAVLSTYPPTEPIDLLSERQEQRVVPLDGVNEVRVAMLSSWFRYPLGIRVASLAHEGWAWLLTPVAGAAFALILRPYLQTSLEHILGSRKPNS